MQLNFASHLSSKFNENQHQFEFVRIHTIFRAFDSHYAHFKISRFRNGSLCAAQHVVCCFPTNRHKIQKGKKLSSSCNMHAVFFNSTLWFERVFFSLSIHFFIRQFFTQISLNRASYRALFSPHQITWAINTYRKVQKHTIVMCDRLKQNNDQTIACQYESIWADIMRNRNRIRCDQINANETRCHSNFVRTQKALV